MANASWTAGSGSWGSGASSNWSDANSIQAAPGTFAGFDNTDSATFSGAGATVSLDGTSP